MISAFLCWGTPFGPLFWGRCFGSVGRLCPKPQFMGPPFLHTSGNFCLSIFYISGLPFSPLSLMCFGSVGRARPKPQFMTPLFTSMFEDSCLSIVEPLLYQWRGELQKHLQDKLPKNRKFSAPKKEVISILKNARFKGSGAKSWPWTFLCISDNFCLSRMGPLFE